jgi:hypothetical protein
VRTGKRFRRPHNSCTFLLGWQYDSIPGCRSTQ